MDITKKVMLSLDEIMALRSSIRARLREINRMLKRCDDLAGMSNDKTALEKIYEKLGEELDRLD